MRIFSYKKFKTTTVDFYRTVIGQLLKDITNLWRSGYIPFILFFMIAVTSFLLHMGYRENNLSSSTWSYKQTTAENIITLAINPWIQSGFSIFLMVIPALNFTEDFENRNFEILKVHKINPIGYYIGKILSSLFFIVLIILMIAYISEGTLFYDGYQITPRFLIAPIYVTLAFIPTLILIFSIFILASIIVSSRIGSILLVILYSIFIPQLIHSINSFGPAPKISLLNTFLYLLSGKFSTSIPYSILGINATASTSALALPELLPTSYPELMNIIFFSTAIFLFFGFIALCVRYYSSGIIEKFYSIREKVFKKEVKR